MRVAGPQCHTSVTLLFVGDFCRYDLAGKRTSLWGPQNEGDASCCRLTQVREDFGRRSVSTVFIIADVVFRPQALPDAQESDDWEVLPCYREPIIRDLLTRTSAQVVLALAPPMRTPMRLGELSPRLGARLISVQTGCRCSACRSPRCSAALLLLEQGGGTFVPAAVWPAAAVDVGYLAPAARAMPERAARQAAARSARRAW
jgi:hypothetical protein